VSDAAFGRCGARIGRAPWPHGEWQSSQHTFFPEALESFVGDDGDHDEGRHRIGPPPSQRRVEEQPAQEEGGKVRAEHGLLGIGGQSATAQLGGHAALGAGEQGHDDKRQDSNHDAYLALLRALALQDGPDGIDSHVDCKGEEAAANDAERETVRAFATCLIEIRVESPDRNSPGR